METIILYLFMTINQVNGFGVLFNKYNCSYSNKNDCLKNQYCGWCNYTIDDDDDNSTNCKIIDPCTLDDTTSSICEISSSDDTCSFNIILLTFLLSSLAAILWWVLLEQFKTTIEVKDKQLKYYCTLCKGKNNSSVVDKYLLKKYYENKCKKCVFIEKKYYSLSKYLASFTLGLIIIPLTAVFYQKTITFALIIIVMLLYCVLSLNLTMCFIRTTPVENNDEINDSESNDDKLNDFNYFTF